MTLMQLAALVPPLCRMAADPAVQAALNRLSSDAPEDFAPLAAAMAAHPLDARRALTILGSGDPPTTETLRRRFPREALAFFHLCAQCAPEEILRVLTRCTIRPTAEALAILIGERRRERARELCALQALCRMDGSGLPEELVRYPSEDGSAPPAAQIIHNLRQRLRKEAP